MSNTDHDKLHRQLQNVKLEENTAVEKRIKQKLSNLPCTFTCRPKSSSPYNTHEAMLKKLLRKEEQNRLDKCIDVNVPRMAVALALTNEYAQLNDFESALKYAKKCSDFVQSEDLSVYYDGLNKVAMANKAHVLYLKGDTQEAEELADSLLSASRKDEYAVIAGIIAAVWMEYGIYGDRRAVRLVQDAIKKETNDCRKAQWYLLLGKSLRRVRRHQNRFESPNTEELDALENAVRLADEDLVAAAAKMFLAEAYRERSAALYHKNKGGPIQKKSVIIQLNAKAAALFVQCIKGKHKNVSILVRCASNLCRLPPPHRNLEFAMIAFKKVEKIAPNSPTFALSFAGYYENHRNLKTKAEEYYRIAAAANVFWAELKLIHLRWIRERRSYDPVPDLRMLKEKYGEEQCIATSCHIGSFLWFTEKDWKSAVTEWLEAVKLNPSSSKLKKHTHLFVKGKEEKEVINIPQFLVEQLGNLARSSKSSDDREFYESGLKKLAEYRKKANA